MHGKDMDLEEALLDRDWRVDAIGCDIMCVDKSRILDGAIVTPPRLQTSTLVLCVSLTFDKS